MFNDSNQERFDTNWNLGEKGSKHNHKIIEIKKVSSENHNDISRIIL